MTLKLLWVLFPVVALMLWMIFNCHQSRGSNRFVLKVFGALLLLLAFCLPGLVSQESRVAAKVLADALGGLSDTDLKQEHDFV